MSQPIYQLTEERGGERRVSRGMPHEDAVALAREIRDAGGDVESLRVVPLQTYVPTATPPRAELADDDA